MVHHWVKYTAPINFKEGLAGLLNLLICQSGCWLLLREVVNQWFLNFLHCNSKTVINRISWPSNFSFLTLFSIDPLNSIYVNMWHFTRPNLFCFNFVTMGLSQTLNMNVTFIMLDWLKQKNPITWTHDKSPSQCHFSF